MAAKVESDISNVHFLRESITGATTKKRPVTVVRDHVVEFPDLYLDVYLEGPLHDQAGFAEMFARSASKRVTSPLDADIVVFTGGSDVDPSLYNEEKHARTHFNRHRDDVEMRLYLTCLNNGIPMFGVCRGAQFLHVMNGGKLFQDIDGHHGDHGMYSLKDNQFIPTVSSVHHQSCMPNQEGGMEILGTVSRSTERWFKANNKEMGKTNDIEAYFYRDTCCLGVQGHPEYRNYPIFTKWCLDAINHYIICNPDTEFRNRNRRIKPDILEQRKLGFGTKLPVIEPTQETN